MPKLYDLAVIGAGPAGASAAITAARAGARVLLLERGSFPREKVCGEFVSSESLELLRSLLAGNESAGLLYHAPRIVSARTFIDGETIGTEISPPAFSIPRYEMDAALWRSALASGVDARQQVAARRIDRNGNFAVEILASEERFSARAVINAAGRWSNFKAASMGVPSGPKWIGVKAHFAEADAKFSQSLDLHFFSGGYCGVSPLGNGHINACAMVRADVAKNLAEVFRCEARLAERSREWKAVTEEVSTAPLIFHPPAPVANGTLLAGDAAGFIDPFVGDGISMALHSGAMAANALIASGFHVEQAAARYHADYQRRLLPAFHHAARIRSLVSLPYLVRWPMLKMMKVAGISEYFLKRTRAGAAA